jgi:hypothetical protein
MADIIYGATGINFAAHGNVGGMTAELLDDYEEGTWTPAITSTTNVISVSGGATRVSYVRVGQLTQISMEFNNVTLSGTNTSSDNYIGGLPFTSAHRTSISRLNQWGSLFTTNVSAMIQYNNTNLELVKNAYPYAAGDLNNVTSGTYWMLAGSYIST